MKRRDFIKSSAALIASGSSVLGGGLGTAPLVFPATVVGRGGAVAPSDRVTVAMIGMGRQATQINVVQFFGMPDVQVVAVCDVDAWRLENAKRQVENAYA
jgi:hypothetical protein